jgi:hypothetical protein
MKKLIASAVFLSLSGCSWFQAHPAVVASTEACVACVGEAVVANYTAANPMPFYPNLCNQMLVTCGASCGSDLTAVITAVAASADPHVQATPAFPDAVHRRSAMLAK